MPAVPGIPGYLVNSMIDPPYAADLQRYVREDLPFVLELSGGTSALVPVACLRWTHDEISAQMTFKSGGSVLRLH